MFGGAKIVPCALFDIVLRPIPHALDFVPLVFLIGLPEREPFLLIDVGKVSPGFHAKVVAELGEGTALCRGLLLVVVRRDAGQDVENPERQLVLVGEEG